MDCNERGNITRKGEVLVQAQGCRYRVEGGYRYRGTGTGVQVQVERYRGTGRGVQVEGCLLYTSDAADE